MTQLSGTHLESEVAASIKSRGFKTPTRRGHFFWGRSRPDFIVEESGKLVALEVKARPAMLTDIAQISRTQEPGQIGAVLCMPRPALNETPDSVRSYAKQVNVRLCALDEVGEVLADILTQPPSQT